MIGALEQALKALTAACSIVTKKHVLADGGSPL